MKNWWFWMAINVFQMFFFQLYFFKWEEALKAPQEISQIKIQIFWFWIPFQNFFYTTFLVIFTSISLHLWGSEILISESYNCLIIKFFDFGEHLNPQTFRIVCIWKRNVCFWDIDTEKQTKWRNFFCEIKVSFFEKKFHEKMFQKFETKRWKVMPFWELTRFWLIITSRTNWLWS